MIISYKHRFVFVKTKKTAGTSIEHLLSDFLVPGDFSTPLGQRPKPLAKITVESVQLLRRLQGEGTKYRARDPHLPYQVVADYFAEETQGFTTFCVERNPWDKAISAFYFWTSRHPPNPEKSKLQQFEEFAFSRQMGWFSDFGRYMKNDVQQVQHILRYENLVEDLQKVTDIIGLPTLEISQTRSNSDTRPNVTRDLRPYYGEKYDNPLSRRVREVFAKEIEYFGYEPPSTAS